MSSTNAAWLDLQELYSSINYLKAKLNATDQKLRAASEEEPVRVDRQGIPRMATSPPRASQRSEVNTATRWQMAQTRQQQVRFREGRPTYVDPVCINGDARRELSNPFDRVAGLGKSGSLLEGRQQVAEDCRINRGRSSKSHTDKLRKIVERQKRDADARNRGLGSYGTAPTLRAEDTYGMAAFPYVPSPASADAVGSVYGQVGESSKSQYNGHKPQTREVRFAERMLGYPSVPFRETSAVTSGLLQEILCSDAKGRSGSERLRAERRNVFPGTRLASNVGSSVMAKRTPTELHTAAPNVDGCRSWRSERELLGDFYVDDYLRSVGSRRGKESKTKNESNGVQQAVEAPTAIPVPPLRMQELPVTDVPRERAEDVEPAMMKRKVVSVQKAKEYPGFTHRGSARIARKIRRMAPKPPPPTVPLHRSLQKNKTPSVEATSTTGSKENVITPTSWKEGRCFGPKKHVSPPAKETKDADVQRPVKEAARDDILANKENTNFGNLLAELAEDADAHGSDDQVNGEERPNEPAKATTAATEKSVPRFRKSSKRKAQLHSEKTEQSPAPKVRHYDSAAVRHYIMQQRVLRKQQEQDLRHSLAEASTARKSRLESLYAFQRRVASASAKIGQRKSLELQKEQEKEVAFLKSFKAQQDTKSDSSSDSEEIDVADPSDLQEEVAPTAKREIASQTEALSAEGRGPLLEEAHSRHSLASTSSEASSSNSSSPELDHYMEDHFRELLSKAEAENPIPEFKYKPTPQLRHIRQLTIDINTAIDEELEHMGYGTSLQRPQTEPKTGDIASRLWQALSLFDARSLPDLPVPSLLQSVQTSQAGPSKAAYEPPALADVKDRAARQIQRCYRKFRLRKLGPVPQDKMPMTTGDGSCTKPPEERETPDKEDLHIPKGTPQEQRHQDVQTSWDATERSEALGESFYHLMPDPYTFARAWKLKNVKKDFMTSTQSEGRLSPNFSVSSLEVESANTPQAGKQPEQSVSQQHGDDTVISVTLVTDKPDGTATPHRPKRSNETDLSALTKPSSGSRPRTSLDVSPEDEAADAGKAHRSQESRQEKVNQTELPKHSSDVFGCDAKTDDKVWRLLDSQAEAVRASAKAAQRLAEIRGPSLLQQQSEDLARLLTASTVAAASALAASLTAQQGSVKCVISAEQQTEPWKHSTPAVTEYTEPLAIENIDNSATAGSGQTASEEVVPAGSYRSGERNRRSTTEDGNMETSDSSGLVASEEEGSSQVKEGSKADISGEKLAGAHLQSPVSTDQESNDIRNRSLSSTSDPIIFDKDLLSFSSLTDSYFLTSALPNGERPQLALLRLQEKSLIQKTRAELAWLEVLKRKCRECGAEDRVPALRKKQRGLLLKLHQKCAELKLQQRKCNTEGHAPPVAATEEGATTCLDSSISEQLVDLPMPSAASVREESPRDSVPESASKLEASDETREVDTEQGGTTSDAASVSSRGAQEKSASFSLGTTKRTLKEWQQQLAKRRKYVQELLEWQKELNKEEGKVRALERQVAGSLKVASGIFSGRRVTIGSWEMHREEAPATPATEEVSSKYTADPMLRARDNSSLEKFASKGTSSTAESIEEDENVGTKKSKTSTPASEVCSTSFEKDAKSTNEGHASETPSSSREQRPPLNRGLVLRSPLLPMAKGRRDSSGSEDSFNVSHSGPTSPLTETASEQSDMEGQILALKEELKRRQLEAARLKKEQKRYHREFLRQKEQVLRKHIEMYDQLIEDAKAELEKEKIRHVASVKPQIKKPCIAEQQKRTSSDARSGHSLPLGLPIKTLYSSEESSSKISALHASTADGATQKESDASTQEVATEENNQESSLEQGDQTSQEVSNHDVESQGTGHTSIPEKVSSRADSQETISGQLLSTPEWQTGHNSEEKEISDSKNCSFQQSLDERSTEKHSRDIPGELDTTRHPVCASLSQSEVCDGLRGEQSVVPSAQSASDIAEDVPTTADSIPSSAENSKSVSQGSNCDLLGAECRSQASGNGLQSVQGAVQVSGGAECDLRSISEHQAGASVCADSQSHDSGDSLQNTEDADLVSGGAIGSAENDFESISERQTGVSVHDEDEQPVSGIGVPPFSPSQSIISSDSIIGADIVDRAVQDTSVKVDSPSAGLRIVEATSEDDLSATEEVAEYTEEIVQGTFIVQPSTVEKSALGEETVSKMVDSVLEYLCNETFTALKSAFSSTPNKSEKDELLLLQSAREDSSMSEESDSEEHGHFDVEDSAELRQIENEESSYPKKVDCKCEDGTLTQHMDLKGNDDVRKGDGEPQTKPLAEGGTPVEPEIKVGDSEGANQHAESSDADDRGKELSCSQAEFHEPRSMTERDVLTTENLDVLVRKMALDAVRSVLDIARERGREEVLKNKSSTCKEQATLGDVTSDVTKKVSSIMASLEQKKSHRELLRPQDMMVLSSDLDDDFFVCKDSVALEPQGVLQEHSKDTLSSEEKENEEPHQSDDCSPLAIEQDWFEDDFGLGPPFSTEQFAYPRQIPNKPPPPYSPPKGGLAIPKKPSAPAVTSLFSEAEARAVCRKSASLVFAAVMRGDDLDLLECDSLEIMPKEGCRENQAVEKSPRNFCTFLFDLTKELARDVFSIAEVPLPPWQRSCSTRRKLPTPNDENCFVDLVSEKVLRLQETSSKRSTRLCAAARIGRRKRADDTMDDEVDEAVNVVLQREIREEEPEWVDYSGDEVAVKELVSDAIFIYLLDDTIRAFRALDDKR